MHFAVVRDPKSRLLLDRDRADLDRAVEAVDIQLSTQVAPAWGRVAPTIGLYDDVEHVPNGAYMIVLYDSADQPGLLGYHDEEGLPVGKVFLEPIKLLGGDLITGAYALSKTLSHEAIEMFGNPGVNLWVDFAPGSLAAGQLTPFEWSDAVQDDYVVVHTRAGFAVPCSNFLLPPWFDAQDLGAETKYDQAGNLTAPFTMSPGGYLILREADGSVHTVTGAAMTGPEREHVLAKPRTRLFSLQAELQDGPRGARP